VRNLHSLQAAAQAALDHLEIMKEAGSLCEGDRTRGDSVISMLITALAEHSVERVIEAQHAEYLELHRRAGGVVAPISLSMWMTMSEISRAGFIDATAGMAADAERESRRVRDRILTEVAHGSENFGSW
jgi:hypothetical protein